MTRSDLRTPVVGADPGRPLRILQVGTTDFGGGAATVASTLARGFRARGCEAWLAAGQKTSDDPNVFLVPDDDRRLYRISGYSALQSQLRRMASRFPGSGCGWLSRSLRLATHPRALAGRWRGQEDFEFPGTHRLLDLVPARPDIVHCHNLHGGYFDLRALSWLGRHVPTVLTLHDAWLLSGHCAHSFDCERWKTGCGRCPDLAIDPAIRRDATAENWARKRDIYAESRLYVATPCRWLLGKVEQSILAPAVEDARVIPNGVDLSVFRPADKRSVRERLGLSPDAATVLLTTGSRGGMWRSLDTLRAAGRLIASSTARHDVSVIVLGDVDPSLRIDGIDVRFVGYQTDPKEVARYHQAADVYVHAARADTFPSAILEALACGTPVVATAVGGIPEQINPAQIDAIRTNAFERLERATGVLVPAGDADAMADAVLALLTNSASRRILGENAVSDARDRFDSNRQIECHLAWYRAIIDDWNGHAVSHAERTPACTSGQKRMAMD
jgi:glycosyltransferase involved in cell wall biosynthesis